MFAVDPLTLTPEDFYQKVLGKGKIKTPFEKLKVSISTSSKNQIKQFCDRCAKEFNEWFSKGELDLAKYYLSMIEGISEEE